MTLDERGSGGDWDFAEEEPGVDHDGGCDEEHPK